MVRETTPNGMMERDHPALAIGAQGRLLPILRSSSSHEPVGEAEQNLGLMQFIHKPFLDTPFFRGPADDLATAGLEGTAASVGLRKPVDGHGVNPKRIRRLMRLMRLMPI